MRLIVQKYGGTSVGSIEKIKQVAQRVVKEKEKGNQIVAIVSAMGHTTDELIKLMQGITKSPHPREYDMIVSTGEQVSAALLAMAIQNLGYKSISLTGPQAGVVTEDLHAKAKILKVKTKSIKKELKEDKIVVITGFQGQSLNGEITTIGRGGSDTSAVAIAAALKADICEIYTDVKGVYTANPAVVKDARLISEISYEEMLEMASLGAQILHPRAVECALRHHMTIHVRSTFELDEGTLVKEVR